MHYLIIYSPGLPPRTVWLTQNKQTIGRSSRADININDSFASRIHAVLELRGDNYWLTDLGSQNGTYYNETRVSRELCLTPTDRIRIGETELHYYRETAEGAGTKTSVIFHNNQSGQSPEVTLGPEPGTRMSRVLVPSSTQLLSDKQLQRKVAKDFVDNAQQRDLLALVTKVGLMLSDWSLDQLLENILDIVFENIQADRGFLLLVEKSGDLTCKVARYRVPPSTGETPEVAISRHISDLVLQQKSVLTSDAQQDARFAGAQSIVLSGMRSCMAVPLALHEQVLGMIYVDNPYEKRFSEDDLRVLTTIASVAAIKVEQARFLKEHLEKQRIEQELEVAVTIQKRILPQEPPVMDGLEVIGVNIPCHTVGGDYYDFVISSPENIGFCIADVSGKGIPAALLVSTLQATFRATIDIEQPDLLEAISRINKVICRSTPSYSYITFFYGLLNKHSKGFTSVNAGHNAPLVIRRGGKVLKLEKGGFCLGMFEKAQYEIEEIFLEDGDLVCLYTDGLTEANNVEQEEFGEARLITFLQENRTLALDELSKQLYRQIENFVGDEPQHDDLTYILFRLESDLSDGETIIFDIPDDED